MLTAHDYAPATIPANDEQLFKALGAKLAELRKKQGPSQQALTEQLGIAQQTYANYEVARACVAASMLPELARVFGVAVDELLGLRNGKGKCGPTRKFQQQLERIARLHRAQHRLVIQMLDGVLAQSTRA